MRFITFLALTLITFVTQAQKVTGKLVFQPGQVLNITTKSSMSNLVSAMGQEIELKSESTVDQLVQVTNTTEESHTLSQEIKRIRMTSEGMGNNINFDSDKESDLKGQFGGPIKELLGKKINMVIDASGNTLMAMADGAPSKSTADGANMLSQFIGGIGEMTEAPKQGEASFFKVLPATEVGKGDGWTNTIDRNGNKIEEAYSVAEINDNAIILNYLSNSASSRVQENMGMEVTINLKDKTEGKITVDRKTGIVKEKALTTTSTGSVVTGMGEFPINSTSTTLITVN
ncbi:MAG: hypothetical protein FJX92_04135 [Bacteroidetes bacterium]|nr:hypothetical protein [Bacteroidota bacterium]